ncbi:MAG: hypothetical protein ACTSUM_03250 [Alphaproteobacteria bacterium]
MAIKPQPRNIQATKIITIFVLIVKNFFCKNYEISKKHRLRK